MECRRAARGLGRRHLDEPRGGVGELGVDAGLEDGRGAVVDLEEGVEGEDAAELPAGPGEEVGAGAAEVVGPPRDQPLAVAADEAQHEEHRVTLRRRT